MSHICSRRGEDFDVVCPDCLAVMHWAQPGRVPFTPLDPGLTDRLERLVRDQDRIIKEWDRGPTAAPAGYLAAFAVFSVGVFVGIVAYWGWLVLR